MLTGAIVGPQLGLLWNTIGPHKKKHHRLHPIRSAPCIGIDLGTCNSAVALLEGDKPKVLTDEAGRYTIPSVVAFGQVQNDSVTHLQKMFSDPPLYTLSFPISMFLMPLS